MYIQEYADVYMINRSSTILLIQLFLTLCWQSFQYTPFWDNNSACVPSSTTLPLWMMAILSAFWMVDSLWAITTQVRPSRALSSASCTICSKEIISVSNTCRFTHGCFFISIKYIWSQNSLKSNIKILYCF